MGNSNSRNDNRRDIDDNPLDTFIRSTGRVISETLGLNHTRQNHHTGADHAQSTNNTTYTNTENTANTSNTSNTSTHTTPLSYREHVLFNVDIMVRDSCPICLCDFEEGELGCILPCWHIYHRECIDPWFDNHRSCPTCRVTDGDSNAQLEKDNMDRMSTECMNNILFGGGISADLSMVDRLPVKSIKHLLDEFNVDYSLCIDKDELKNLVFNDIFYYGKTSKDLKTHLTDIGVDCTDCVERSELLKLVALTRLIGRVYR